jgi:hypothetical protein
MASFLQNLFVPKNALSCTFLIAGWRHGYAFFAQKQRIMPQFGKYVAPDT